MKLSIFKCKYNVNGIYKLNRYISTGTQTNTCAQIDVCEIIRSGNLLYRAPNKPAQQKKKTSHLVAMSRTGKKRASKCLQIHLTPAIQLKVDHFQLKAVCSGAGTGFPRYFLVDWRCFFCDVFFCSLIRVLI